MQSTTNVVVLITSCLLAGCSNQIDDRLVGKWQIQTPESVNKKVAGSIVDVDDVADSPRMTVEFSRSGKLTTTTKMGKIDSVKTGTWKALNQEQESDLIQIQCQIGLQQTEHEIELTDQDSIRWIPPNMAGTRQKILFSRAKD